VLHGFTKSGGVIMILILFYINNYKYGGDAKLLANILKGSTKLPEIMHSI
jgi:hypothetical protein